MATDNPTGGTVAATERNITRLSLLSYDPETTADFYEMLGFQVNKRTADSAIVSTPGLELQFYQRNSVGMVDAIDVNSEEEIAYVYVPVLKIDEYYSELRSMRVPVTVELQSWPWGRKEFNVIDLDGYYLVFYKPLASEVEGNSQMMGSKETAAPSYMKVAAR